VTTLPPFELHPAHTVAEATELLTELADEAVVYSGGTELLLLLKLGFAAYGHLVDVKPIAELAGISIVDGYLHIGGAVTHRTIERSPLVASGWRELAAMEGKLANVRVRSVGTLGGNLAFADPHSDPATWLLAAGARLVLGLADARRTLPMADFVLGPYATALRPGELVVAIEVPAIPDGASISHTRFAFHERPAATISCLVQVHAGRITDATIAVGSVGVVPVLVPDAAAQLRGEPADDLDTGVLEVVGRAAAVTAEPVTDSNGSAVYKRDLVRVLVGRGVREAAASASRLASAA
jgi:carbon-monoxide dehydrogenase medium subunit